MTSWNEALPFTAQFSRPVDCGRSAWLVPVAAVALIAGSLLLTNAMD
jgi:hypothetical protein